MYFLCSLLGYTVSPLFYVLHLFDIVAKSQILANVIKSVTKPAYSLFMTGILGVIIIYAFAIFAFRFLRSDYDVGDTETYNACDTIARCFLSTVAEGLMNGGGIGEFLTPREYSDIWGYTFYIRFFFDIFFFVLVLVILLNIIFGIIIDTFADLRNSKNEKEYEMKNVCFICSISRYDLDHGGSGFEKHIREEHNMWQYLFYLLYIHSKPSNMHTGIESYVYNLFKTKEIAWFPIGKAMCLEAIDIFEDSFDDSELIEGSEGLEEEGNSKAADLKMVAHMERMQQQQDDIQEQLTSVLTMLSRIQ